MIEGIFRALILAAIGAGLYIALLGAILTITFVIAAIFGV